MAPALSLRYAAGISVSVSYLLKWPYSVIQDPEQLNTYMYSASVYSKFAIPSTTENPSVTPALCQNCTAVLFCLEQYLIGIIYIYNQYYCMNWISFHSRAAIILLTLACYVDVAGR